MRLRNLMGVFRGGTTPLPTPADARKTAKGRADFSDGAATDPDSVADRVYVWTGRAFVARPVDEWGEDRYAFDAAPHAFGPAPAALAAWTAAIGAINPRCRVTIGPILRRYGPYPQFEGLSERLIAATGGRRWWSSVHSGYCYKRKTSILVATCSGNHPLQTLYHELFHSIYDQFDGEELEILEEHGDAIRERNKNLHEFDPGWLGNPEEAEAAAFDRWTAGEPPPCGVAPTSAVARIWHRVVSGKYRK